MKRGKNKNIFLINLIFSIHLILVLIWFGLFLIPVSIWSMKTEFHFWYMTVLLIVQFVWGLALYNQTKKVTFICPFTTLMQFLRGYSIKDKMNYNHSFIAELFSRLKIKLSFSSVNILLIITYIIVAIQFLTNG